MNNDQFRRLVLEKASKSHDDSEVKRESPASILGQRQNPSTYMAPRNLKTSTPNIFKRPGQSSQNQKKFKTAAPRGVKLASGYKDRTLERQKDEEDEKSKQIEKLEARMKAGDIDLEEFDRLRDKITGGDIENTHLVKGLDWELLKRIKRGEDILNKPKNQDDAPVDEDDEFEMLEQKEIQVSQKEEKEKKGSLVAKPVAKSRDQILAELKASRKKGSEESKTKELGSRFRKIGDEPDQRQKQALRKSDQSIPLKGKEEVEPKLIPLDHDLVVPKSTKVPSSESEDSDMYSDVGSDYNALGDSEDEKASPEKSQASAQPRKLFEDDTTSVLNKMTNPLQDASILAALAKQAPNKEASNTEEERLKRKAEILAQQDRDLDDIDMGFSGGRFDEDEDEGKGNKKRKRR